MQPRTRRVTATFEGRNSKAVDARSARHSSDGGSVMSCVLEGSEKWAAMLRVSQTNLDARDRGDDALPLVAAGTKASQPPLGFVAVA